MCVWFFFFFFLVGEKDNALTKTNCHPQQRLHHENTQYQQNLIKKEGYIRWGFHENGKILC